MPPKPQQPDLTQRQDLTYFEGVNSLVGHNLAQKQELYHAENVRSKDIGVLEKREGTARVGNPLDAQVNYGLFDFLNKGVNNSGLYRISTVSEQTNLYFLNSLTNSWNSVVSSLIELGNFSTTYNITQVGTTTTYTYSGVGLNPSISTKAHVGSTLEIQAQNFNALNNGTFVITQISSNSFSVTNATGVAEAGKTIGSGFIRLPLSIGLSTGDYSTTVAEGYLFFVNGVTQNLSIEPDGITVQPASDNGGHLFNSPRARKINYYKDRLYVADYFIDVFPSTPYSLGTSTTTYSISNIGTTFTYTYTGVGTNPLISTKVHVGDVVIINGQNFNSANNGTFTITGFSTNFFTVINASGVSEVNKTLGTGSIARSGSVVTTESTEYPNGVMMSSTPLGILALADGDAAVGATVLPVTDTKYIDIPSSIFVMRGNVLVAIINVTGKTETSITVDPLTTAIQSADELWVHDSIFGTRKFKWNSVPSSGIDVKQYDTFKLTGDNQNDRIRMLTNIGNVMVIANTENVGIWDNYKLDMMDGGIGCVSDNGFAKIQGQLFFLHYSGIYMTQGAQPQLISGPVTRYFRGATRAGLENGAMGTITRRGISLFCSIGDVTLYREDGSFEKTLNNVVLEYNLQQKVWFVHSELPISHWSSYIEATDPDKLLFASDDVGANVYEFLVGPTDTQDGTRIANIPMRLDTNRLYMGKQYDRIGTPLEIGVEAERGANIRSFVSLDAQPYYEIPGQSGKGISILKIANVDGDSTTPPRARFMRISLRDYSNQTVKISRIFLTHLEATERENIRSEGSAEA